METIGKGSRFSVYQDPPKGPLIESLWPFIVVLRV